MDKVFLDLGIQPLANNFQKNLKSKNQKFYRLKVIYNTNDFFVKIQKRISKNVMFNNKYPYRSSLSKTFLKNQKKLSKKIKNIFKPKKILEIGSNDGSFIKNFSIKKAICVEPCSNLAKITKDKGYKTYSTYWNTSLAEKIKKDNGNVDIIYSANTITHISDLKNVFNSIKKILNPNGVLIIEDPSLLECIKYNSYDQFYNEHIYIFSLLSLNHFLDLIGFCIFNVENVETHGGSLRYYIKFNENQKYKKTENFFNQLKIEKKFGLNKLSTYKKFSNRVLNSKKKLISILKIIKDKGQTVIGYGATAKSVTVLNFCKIDSSLIKFFVDTTPAKQFKYIPGTDIFIKPYSKKLIKKVHFIFLGAWNFKKEIFNKEKNFIKKKGRFIIHVPFPTII